MARGGRKDDDDGDLDSASDTDGGRGLSGDGAEEQPVWRWVKDKTEAVESTARWIKRSGVEDTPLYAQLDLDKVVKDLDSKRFRPKCWNCQQCFERYRTAANVARYAVLFSLLGPRSICAYLRHLRGCRKRAQEQEELGLSEAVTDMEKRRILLLAACTCGSNDVEGSGFMGFPLFGCIPPQVVAEVYCVYAAWMTMWVRTRPMSFDGTRQKCGLVRAPLPHPFLSLKSLIHAFGEMHKDLAIRNEKVGATADAPPVSVVLSSLLASEYEANRTRWSSMLKEAGFTVLFEHSHANTNFSLYAQSEQQLVDMALLSNIRLSNNALSMGVAKLAASGCLSSLSPSLTKYFLGSCPVSCGGCYSCLREYLYQTRFFSVLLRLSRETPASALRLIARDHGVAALTRVHFGYSGKAKFVDESYGAVDLKVEDLMPWRGSAEDALWLSTWENPSKLPEGKSGGCLGGGSGDKGGGKGGAGDKMATNEGSRSVEKEETGGEVDEETETRRQRLKHLSKKENLCEAYAELILHDACEACHIGFSLILTPAQVCAREHVDFAATSHLVDVFVSDLAHACLIAWERVAFKDRCPPRTCHEWEARNKNVSNGSCSSSSSSSSSAKSTTKGGGSSSTGGKKKSQGQQQQQQQQQQEQSGYGSYHKNGLPPHFSDYARVVLLGVWPDLSQPAVRSKMKVRLSGLKDKEDKAKLQVFVNERWPELS